MNNSVKYYPYSITESNELQTLDGDGSMHFSLKIIIFFFSWALCREAYWKPKWFFFTKCIISYLMGRLCMFMLSHVFSICTWGKKEKIVRKADLHYYATNCIDRATFFFARLYSQYQVRGNSALGDDSQHGSLAQKTIYVSGWSSKSVHV